MPVLITVLSMRSWEAKYRIVFFLCASLFFFTYFSLYGGPIRLLMFVSGILLYETIENKFIQGMPPLGLPALLIAILSVVLLKTFDSNGWWGYVLLYMLFYVFCLEPLAKPIKPKRHVINHFRNKRPRYSRSVFDGSSWVTLTGKNKLF
jgi:hypothetical protein